MSDQTKVYIVIHDNDMKTYTSMMWDIREYFRNDDSIKIVNTGAFGVVNADDLGTKLIKLLESDIIFFENKWSSWMDNRILMNTAIEYKKQIVVYDLSGNLIFKKG